MSEAVTSAILWRTIFVAAATLLAVASASDIATRKIPDCIPIGLVAIGIATRLASHDANMAVVASASVFVCGALCWRQGWLGGGDVKLGAACAWLMAPALVPKFVLLTALVGGGLASLYLVTGWFAKGPHAPELAAQRRSLIARVWRIERWRISRRASLPYGCAVAAATLLIMLSG